MLFLWAQRLVLVVFLVLFLRGQGAHGTFLVGMGILPLLGLVFSKNRRAATRARLQWHYARLADSTPSCESWKAAFWIIALPFLVLSLANGVGISSYDNYGPQMSAASLVTDGNLELSEYAGAMTADTYFLEQTGKGVRTGYPLGMTAPLTLSYSVARLLRADVTNATVQWRLAKLTATGLATLTLLFFFFVCRRFASRDASLVMAAFVGLGSILFSTLGQGTWSQLGVVVGTAAVLYLEFFPPQLVHTQPRHVFVFGALFAFMFTCRLNSAPLLAVLGFWLCLRRGWVFTAAIALVAGLLLTPLAVYYQSVFGTVFGPNFNVAQNEMSKSAESHLFAVLFSPARGLFVYQPWLLLLGALMARGPRRYLSRMTGERGGVLLLLGFVVVSGVQIIFVSRWPHWHGGITWGSRLLSELILPLALLALPVVEWLWNERGKAGRMVLGVFFLLGFAVQFPAVFLYAGNWYMHPRAGDTRTVAERMLTWGDAPFLFPFRK